ncbi:MAG: hypothetical protein GX417_12765 [Clostridiales bacterium]|nr:hypothetical protein [Clostridiales bacterium]
MKPYLESVRRLSRTGLALFALSAVASVVVAMQFCMQPYLSALPRMNQMFSPLVVFTYLGGLALAMDGFSFLNKRSDSDYYHSLPISRKKLFWAVTLAALTWIAATVLASVLLTTIVFTITKVSFVTLYPIVAVPFYIVATMLVFAAASIAVSLTGTFLTDIALAALVLGLLRFIQFTVARGVVADAQIVGWLDLPWYLSPVTNIATGQIAMLTRHMLDARLYDFGNIGYSALLAVGELFLASLFFARRPSELAEHGAKNGRMQTLFACLAVLPVGMLFSSGVVAANRANILLLLAISVGIYVIYQFVVLRAPQRVLRSLPWLLVPLALAASGYFATQGVTLAIRNDIPRLENVAYVQFGGSGRGTDYVSYQQYRVSQVRFTENEVKQLALSSLRDNVASIERLGYVSIEYNPQGNYYSVSEPVTFVLNNGRRVSRVVTFQNQNQLYSIRESNQDYADAIRALPPEYSVCYLQGENPYSGGFVSNKSILRAYYQEISETRIVPNDSYRLYDPNVAYNINEWQAIGSLNLTGYVGMQRYEDYYNIRLELPDSSSAWMYWQNERSSNEYLDLLQQIVDRSESFTGATDYLDCSMMFYNMPMSDGTNQSVSFYYGGYAHDENNYYASFLPLMKEICQILLRSEPTTDPSGLFVYTSWSGRALGEDGTFIGADIMAANAATNGNASDNNVFYSSSGVAYYTGNTGSIISYNPSYRSFTPSDEARLIELLEQWETLQKTLSYSGAEGEQSVTIDSGLHVYASPTPQPTPAG